MTAIHVPVLAGELIEALDPRPGQVAIDATVGGCGHASLIAERIGSAGTLIGIDRDPIAEERFAALAAEVSCNTRFIRATFADGLAQLVDEGVEADMVTLDLGMSSLQVDTRDRGFSYSYDAPLDMRMDPDQELTAAVVVNTFDERQITRLLREYGEERYAGPIARSIVRRRRDHTFETTQELVDTIKSAIPVPAQFAGGHPAKRSFQAIRIAVNDELDQLDQALPLAWRSLAVGGRVGVISFHSLEDRRVKRFLTAQARGCVCPPDLPICACGQNPKGELLSRRAIAPTAGEIAANPRAKSAHLRAARKVEQSR
ncbi:MAG: 16S rRNA (cytosine(1402)-N(4))-methyltransferase RsmH [Solirubrobacterales bacterium]|nr:16S rRNA (cytosine(1402)-N(4))-methyltransferase RsmH [Solirubrobacterales bacterium]